jgi:hypothetical protein
MVGKTALKDSPPPLCVFPLFPLQPAVAGINQNEVLVASEVYHVVIATDIPVNGMARRLEGYIWK